jgi:hypothetical protein
VISAKVVVGPTVADSRSSACRNPIKRHGTATVLGHQHPTARTVRPQRAVPSGGLDSLPDALRPKLLGHEVDDAASGRYTAAVVAEAVYLTIAVMKLAGRLSSGRF